MCVTGWNVMEGAGVLQNNRSLRRSHMLGCMERSGVYSITNLWVTDWDAMEGARTLQNNR